MGSLQEQDLSEINQIFHKFQSLHGNADDAFLHQSKPHKSLSSNWVILRPRLSHVHPLKCIYKIIILSVYNRKSIKVC